MEAGSGVGRAPAMWEESLAKVVPAIVVIRVCSVGAYDGDGAGYSKATGFVVDKARGIILTNRHVVTPGPTVADAIFVNKEEVDLVPIYYDPVHDFGFYRFDPKAVKFLEVTEVELNPEGAKVGVEIRVVGNDSGEKLSILPGILARLDRAAPEYDSFGYRDFNTFYLAAASSTSGGSSGSPVLTMDGKAVALNCGARVETAAAFYFPLPKIVRALEMIQRGEKVTRGTFQTVLNHTAFDEARRLGLQPDTEALLRKEFPEETGVLSVVEVLPKGPADGVLEPGDVVVRMNGKLITTFLPWELALDDGVGHEMEVQVQRGGKEVDVRLTVGDLQAITPSEFLDVSASVLHPLSYQQARNYNLPVEGVYLAQAGYMLERAWVTGQCLITSIGSDPTPDLDACEAALCKHADGARVSVRYKALADRHRTKTAVITIDRKWYTMQRVRRNDDDGLWHATPSPLPPSAPPPPPPAPPSTVAVSSKAKTAKGKGETDGIFSSLVMVVFDIPHLVDGVSGSYCIGVGVVVDKELGLVVVDRNTVQVSLGDVMLTFNGSEEVAAWPIFSHPTQNFGVVQFDPSSVRGSFTAAALSSRETEHDDDDDENDDESDGGFDGETGGDEEGGDGGVGGGRAESSGKDSASVAVDRCAESNGAVDNGRIVNAPSGVNEKGTLEESGSASNGDKTLSDAVTVAKGTADEDGAGGEEDDGGKRRMAPPEGTVVPPQQPEPETTLGQAESGVGINGSIITGASTSTSSSQTRPTAATPASSATRDVREATRGTAGGDDDESTFDDSPPPLRPGDMAEFYGLTAANAPVHQRAAVVKLERLSLASSSHPQFTAHSVEVLQFDQIASCLGGVFVAIPREDEFPPSPSSSVGGTTKRLSRGVPSSCGANSSAATPVVSAFWHSFAFSTSDGRKHTLRGLPSPVVRGAVERVRRDLLLERERARAGSSEEAGYGKGARAGNGEEGQEQEEPLGTTSEGRSPAVSEIIAVVDGDTVSETTPVEGRDSAAPSSGKGDDDATAAETEASPAAASPVEEGRGPTESVVTPGGGVAAAAPEESTASTGGEAGDGHVEGEESNPAATSAKADVDEVSTSEAGTVSTSTSSSAIAITSSKLLGTAPCLPLQLVTVELSKARAGLGLSDEWSSKIERKCGNRRQKQVLEVRRCMAGTPAFSVIETGDIILAVNGKLVTRFREAEVAVEQGEGEPVKLSILRELEEKEIMVTPSHLPTRETDRLIMWAGQMVQEPHLAVCQLGFLPKEGGGVYSSRWCYGSPAHKYNLGCTTFIVEVNGIPTPSLDDFLDVVKHIGDRSPARIKTVGLDSKVEVTTLRTDHHYWPTLELRRTRDGWTRTLHKSAPSTTATTKQENAPDPATDAAPASASGTGSTCSLSSAPELDARSCDLSGGVRYVTGYTDTSTDDAASSSSRLAASPSLSSDTPPASSEL
ncbi:unnamed protein product, partial [Scytosiphon promiscuus]